MDRRTLVSLSLGALSVACAAGAFEPRAGHSQLVVEPLADGEGLSLLQGVIGDADTGEAIKDSLVIVQCDCLKGVRETVTNADGVYQFRDLPPGKYTIQVLFGSSNVSRSFEMGPAVRVRANFRLTHQAPVIIT